VKFTFEQLADLSNVEGGRFAVSNYSEAEEFCRVYAKSHYENFPVASRFLPRRYRKHIATVYTFARIADDIADENLNVPANIRFELLKKYGVNYKLNSDTTNPVFLALRHTMEELALPFEPFDKLLVAFERDVFFRQPKTVEDLYDYCTYSANPIGELVLRIFDAYNETTRRKSDSICTSLQLTNFWQDLSRDLEKGRLFIPSDYLQKYDINSNDLFEKKQSENLKECLIELINITELEFFKGYDLYKHLPGYRLPREIKASVLGGLTILKKCRQLNKDLLNIRPKLEKSDIFVILVKSLLT
jgi:squalene synthase HpnC